MARLVAREAPSGVEGVLGSRGRVEMEVGCDGSIVTKFNWTDEVTLFQIVYY